MRRLRVLPVLLLATACAGEPRQNEPLELETVDVGAPVDADLSTEADRREVAPRDQGWILEGMLPPDLPLHRPARLVDSGDLGGGRRYFVFQTATPLGAVRAGLERRLAEAGWSAGGAGAGDGGGGLTASKGGERVDFSFSELRPGTEIRVEY